MNEVLNIVGGNLNQKEVMVGGGVNIWLVNETYFYSIKQWQNQRCVNSTISYGKTQDNQSSLGLWNAKVQYRIPVFSGRWNHTMPFEKMTSPTRRSSRTWSSMGVTQGRKWPTHWSTFHFRLSLFTDGPSFSPVLPVNLLEEFKTFWTIVWICQLGTFFYKKKKYFLLIIIEHNCLTVKDCYIVYTYL